MDILTRSTLHITEFISSICLPITGSTTVKRDRMKTMDHEAFFQQIYEDYYSRVLSYIKARVNNPHDAEDLTGDVFFKCYKNIEKYDPEKAAASTWVFVIANNTLKNYYRDNKQEASIDNMEGFDVPYEEEFDQAMRLNEISEYLDGLLSTLDETKRQVLILRYYEDMKTKDIGEKLGLTPANVRVILSRTLQQLNVRVQDEEVLQIL